MGLISRLRLFGRRRVIRRPTGVIARVSKKLAGTTTVKIVKPTTTSIRHIDFTTGESKTISTTTSPSGVVSKTISRTGAKPVVDVLLTSSERQAISRSSAGQQLSSFEKSKLQTGRRKVDEIATLTGLTSSEVLGGRVWGNQLLIQRTIREKEIMRTMPPGRKEFTIAKDVGGGFIQDVHVVVVNGRIVSEEARGDAIPMTQRFRESGRIGKPIGQLVEEKIGKPVLTVERAETRKFKEAPLDISSQKINELRRKLRTASTREQAFKIQRQLALLGLTVGVVFLDTLRGFRDAPKSIKELVKNPEKIKQIPGIIKTDAINFGQLLRVSPTEAIAKIGAEYFVLRGIGKGVKIIGKVSRRAIARASPKFLTRVTQIATTIPIKIGGKTVVLKTVGKVPIETIKRQIEIAGKKVPVITTAQSSKLISLMKQKKIIRKPIPQEATLSGRTRKLLADFDRGRLSIRQMNELDLRVQSETGQALLERSLFADPRGRIRPSRLGVLFEEEAKLIDILAGDVSFTSPKPQILIFLDEKIEKFPTALRKIKIKIAKGQTLTKKESKVLLQFQLKKTGKFKPLGFVSKESEVTLAPGDLIKRVKKVGII